MATPKPDPRASLSPLSSEYHADISVVTFFAFLSMVSTAALVAYLTWRLTSWKHRGYARANQYVALLVNLIAADLIQAVGFALDVVWLRENAIKVPSPTCWTQGWLINAGDVGSAVFTFAMAIHLFMDIILDKRMPYWPFLGCIVLGWIFNFFCATIGIILHPRDFYVRAGLWCWINSDYMPMRLWLHYTWILVTEFGVVVIYSVMLAILWKRVRTVFYATSDLRLRAQSAVKSILLYPLVYVVCTLPAVIIRVRVITGGVATVPQLTALGAMLVSNGWLDVLLYTITRSSLIFGPAAPDDDVYALETFTRFQPDSEGHSQRFSTAPISPTKFHHSGDLKWPTSSPTSESSGVARRGPGERESFASFEKRFEFDLDGLPKKPADHAVIVERYEEEEPQRHPIGMAKDKKRRRRSTTTAPSTQGSPKGAGEHYGAFDVLDSMMTRLPLLVDKRSVKRRSNHPAPVQDRSLEVLVPQAWKSPPRVKPADMDRRQRMKEAVEMRKALNWMIRNDEKERNIPDAHDMEIPKSPVDFTKKG
ncbi:hypothetical protein AC578_3852 [Pseudocercospora eumusae]|uniref:Uncharacterized protein n=1 Tax=Pseudocercospora eumusae TaxID=321146 RepID=A0A139GWW3_9PEZI|nr:hypothetical protein AC578_3852 [Pseudocercospora eumusae]